MKLKKWQLGCLISLAILACSALCLLASVIFTGSQPVTIPTANLSALPLTNTPKQLSTETSISPLPSSAPMDTPAPTFTQEITPSPVVILEPHQALRVKVEQVLQKGNRNIPRLTALNFDDPEPEALFVNWAINDNLTDGLIIFGAKRDATELLKAIDESEIDYTYILLSGSFLMVDAYGKTDEKNVVNLIFYKDTVDRIEWENFLSDNIYLIADEANIWAALQGDWKPSPAP